MITKNAALAALATIAASGSALADVTISTAATQNMTCSGGVCAPTATDAVLNVIDLQTLLSSGGVEVTTTGLDGIQANNIDVDAALSWSSANMLSLDAYQAISVNKEISVAGLGGLSLATFELSFPMKGRVVFSNLSSQLTINGTAYTLVNSIQSLASGVAANPSGTFALADDYDASGDGTYSASPVQTTFNGIFGGMGNAISHLSIAPPSAAFVGLFSIAPGTIENLDVLDARVVVKGGSWAGILTGIYGYLTRVYVSGSVIGKGTVGNAIGGLSGGANAIEYCHANVRVTNTIGSAGGLQSSGGNIYYSLATGSVTITGSGDAGGLVGLNDGSILNSYATAAVTVGTQSQVGGLAGDNEGDIEQSFATGAVASGDQSQIGGLVGYETSEIQSSYSTGAVSGGASSRVGGLIGAGSKNGFGVSGAIKSSYATGAVSGGSRSLVGGFAGTIYRPSSFRYHKYDYWDTTTSGTDLATGRGVASGVAGLTTTQLQSGLPQGFDPKIWAEDSNINNGLPYLIANPPVK